MSFSPLNTNEEVVDFSTRMQSNYDAERKKLIDYSTSSYFTVDVPTLTEQELRLQDLMFQERSKLLEGSQ